MGKHSESVTKFIKRKAGDFGSLIYRKLVFPFVKMGMERKYDSIFGKNVYIMGGSTFKGKDYLGDNAILNNVHMGYGSVISRDSVVTNTRIGNYSSVGCVETFLGRHPVKGENISTHPAFFSTAKQFGYSYVNEDSFAEAVYTDEKNGIQIEIGNDVWIGAGTRLCEGITIGDGAAIGACSLVTKSVEPYAIYAGVPAKKIGQRFNDEQIEKLMKIKWWERDEEWIMSHAALFKDPANIDKLLE